MKKYFKKISIVLIVFSLVFIFLFQAAAETIYNYSGYSYYTLTNTTASLCGWDNRAPELSVPKSILEHYIVEISDNALKNDADITSVDFSKATMLNRIGSYSFYNCSNITGEVIFPIRVNSLGTSVFQGCSSLESVKMKTSGISVITDQAFYKCSGLTEVILPENLTTINKLAFANCTSLNEIEIPKTVTSINASAFKNDTGLLIKGYRDSYAQEFALANGYDFYILDPLYGDANADGSVNILDVTAIQKYKIGTQELTEYGLRCADTDHNGTVTIRDATLIQMYLARMINDF